MTDTASLGRDIAGREQVELDLEQRNLELAALNAIASSVSQSLDMTKILNDALDKTLEVMELDGEARGGIFLLNEGADELHLAALRGLPAEFIEREATIRLDKCLCGRVIKAGEIIDSTRVDAPPDRPGWVEPHGHLLVPLKSKGKVLGVMFLYLPLTHRPCDLQAQLLIAIGNQIGVGIENAQLYEHLGVQARNLELLYEAGRQFSSSLEPQEVLSQIASRCAQLFEADACLVHLVEGDLLTVRASHYRDEAERAQAEKSLLATPRRMSEGLIGWVATTGEPILSTRTNPVEALPPDDTEYWGSREWLLAPLRAQDRVLGVLTLTARSERRRFSEYSLALVQEIAQQAAAALDNAQAHRDLAERAQQLEALYKELAETDRLKDEMVQNISHELRMPLTFLKGYVELTLDEAFGPLPPILRRPLEIVGQKTGIVARLVDRIVNLQAVRRETLSVEPLRLTDLVQEATNHVKPHAERSGVTVELELPTSLPQVAGDRRMLAEALDNLLNNAIKFSPPGGRVRVSLHVEREVVCLEVADTGIGIPTDKLSKIFDRFYQVDGTAARRFGGVGVGLALVQQIIQAHGGQVWAESTGLNRGSIFHLALPTIPMS